MKIGVIGAGIVGLSHAWLAAERGHDVTVFERTARASGASIRNFGMVWPIGQPAGLLHETALRSRERWLQLSQRANVWANPSGSVHLAHHPDEWQVLCEFDARSSQLGYECSLLSAKDIQSMVPGANLDNLIGGLFSPTEVGVNPRAAIHGIPVWLSSEFGVKFQFETTITQIEESQIVSSRGIRSQFDQIIVCGGADFETLFPDLLAQSGLKRCKLQMMATFAQPDQWKIGPMIASGLTLRHYKNFEVCPSLTAVKQRFAAQAPELDRFGIHVMASQTDEGCVIMGDSHEYDDQIEPFDKSEIDELMLRELRKVVQLPDWKISKRWHGIYAKHPTLPIFAAEPMPNVFIRFGPGGAGMTLAFGLAERDWEQWN